ncbi:MAG: DUF4922 domain-containing protein [Bacteroidales bacterium]|nr:DUF4922 domain-containing protein [Bacteroidales bacterium]
MNQEIAKFVRDQLSVWPLAAANFRSLKAAEVRELEVNGLTVRLQHNPGRIRSSAAKVDTASIRSRKCFLCAENRPPEQLVLPFEGRKGRKYHILVNPYPIFPAHLTIVRDRHVDQSIWHQYVDMMDLARRYCGLTVFYNGPRCGASAPDHLHFQACPSGLMPVEAQAQRLLDEIARSQEPKSVAIGDEPVTVPASLAADMDYIASVQDAQLFHYKHFTRGVFFLRARTSKSMAKLFYRLLDAAPVPQGEKEPMFNLLTWYTDFSHTPEYRAVVFFRGAHRSHHYFAEGPEHLTMSPGSADMAGLLIVPQAEDYAKLDSRLVAEMMAEVSVSEEVEKEIIWRLTRTQPKIQVGIMSGNEIVFEIISDGAGPQKVSYREGKIDYNGTLYDELFFEAMTMSTLFAEPTFILYGVTIGSGFHWERRETQKFAGSLKFIVENNQVVAVNLIGVEDYLVSVISSEMSPSASLEFLKAHAVISRSWVMSQVARRHARKQSLPPHYEQMRSLPAVLTELDARLGAGPQAGQDAVVIRKWFDHEDHKRFDVCADDHCQRYQGLTRATGANVRKAIDSTWGEVLQWGGEICDARFSKCCGGRSECFSSCWEDKELPYIQSLPDTPDHKEGLRPFCDTDDKAILAQVLNDFDQETPDFYRWQVCMDRAALSGLISRRSGYDIGTLQSLEALQRGPSGRITELKITGDRKTLIVGKELMIRRILSESHLKSSAFTVSWDGDTVRLDGRGWGHGAGLCQIGAAVMSTQGYGYRAILQHYYPGTQLQRV